jgi:hypothetical protein
LRSEHINQSIVWIEPDDHKRVCHRGNECESHLLNPLSEQDWTGPAPVAHGWRSAVVYPASTDASAARPRKGVVGFAINRRGK